jgi:hypothetical protein
MVRETQEMGIATIVLVQQHQHRYFKILHENKFKGGTNNKLVISSTFFCLSNLGIVILPQTPPTV